MGKWLGGSEAEFAENTPELILDRFNDLEVRQEKDFLDEINQELFFHFLSRYTVNIRVAIAKPKGSEIVIPAREKEVKKGWMNKPASHGVFSWANRHFFLPICIAQLNNSSGYQRLMHSDDDVFAKTAEAFVLMEANVNADLEYEELEPRPSKVVGGKKLFRDVVYNGKRIRKELPTLRTMIDYIDSLTFWPLFAWFIEVSKIAVEQSAINPEELVVCDWTDLAKENNVPEEAIDFYFLPVCKALNETSRNYIRMVRNSRKLIVKTERFLQSWRRAIKFDKEKRERLSKNSQVPTRHLPRTTFVRGTRRAANE